MIDIVASTAWDGRVLDMKEKVNPLGPMVDISAQ